MFVRVRKNKSGSSSVYLLSSFKDPDKKSPSTKVIKSFGSSSDPVRLKELVEEAEDLKARMSSEPASYTESITPYVFALGPEAFYYQIFTLLFPNLLPSSKDMQTLIDLVSMSTISPDSQLESDFFFPELFKTELDDNQIQSLMDKLDDSVIEKIQLSVL